MLNDGWLDSARVPSAADLAPESCPRYDAPRLLSIDAGGTRALAALCVLDYLEQRVNVGQYMVLPLGGCFDHLAGTSSGAILAAGLSVNNPSTGRPNTAAELRAMFERCAQEVFATSWWRKLTSVDGLVKPRHDTAKLEEILSAYGIDRQTKLRDVGRRLTLVAVDAATGRPQIHCSSDRTSDVSVLDAVLASSACPVVFPLHHMLSEGCERTEVDGALAAANPAVTALARDWAEAGCREPRYVVSVGTAVNGGTCVPAADAGLLGLREHLAHWFVDAQQEIVTEQADAFLDEGCFHRLEPAIATDMPADAADADSLRHLVSQAEALIDAHRNALEDVADDLRAGARRVEARTALRRGAADALGALQPIDRHASARAVESGVMRDWFETLQHFYAEPQGAHVDALYALLSDVRTQLSVCRYASVQMPEPSPAPLELFATAYESLRLWQQLGAPTQGTQWQALRVVLSRLAQLAPNPMHLCQDLALAMRVGDVPGHVIAMHLRALLGSPANLDALAALSGKPSAALEPLWRRAQTASEVWIRLGASDVGAARERICRVLAELSALCETPCTALHGPRPPTGLRAGAPSASSRDTDPVVLFETPDATVVTADVQADADGRRLFLLAQRAAAQAGAGGCDVVGDALVGFLQLPLDAYADLLAQQPAQYWQSARHGASRQVVGAALRGYIEQAAAQVPQGDRVRMMLTAYGSVADDANDPAVDFVRRRDNVDAAMAAAFSPARLSPLAAANGPASAVLGYRIFDAHGEPWRDIEVRVRTLAPDQESLTLLTRVLAYERPHAVLCLAAGPGACYRAVHRADDADLLLGHQLRPALGRPAEQRLADNYSLARAIGTARDRASFHTNAGVAPLCCPARRERIVSLDGGDAAEALSMLEQLAALQTALGDGRGRINAQRGGKSEQPRAEDALGNHVDRFVGTSVGALIAAVLALPDPDTGAPRSATDALPLVRDALTQIFVARPLRSLNRCLNLDETGPREEIPLALARLGIAPSTRVRDARTPLTIVAYDRDTGRPRVFSSTQDSGDITVADALLAACQVPPFVDRSGGSAHDDRAAVICRNPTLDALQSINEERSGAPRRFDVLSVGTRRLFPPPADPTRTQAASTGAASGGAARVDPETTAALLAHTRYQRLLAEIHTAPGAPGASPAVDATDVGPHATDAATGRFDAGDLRTVAKRLKATPEPLTAVAALPLNMTVRPHRRPAQTRGAALGAVDVPRLGCSREVQTAPHVETRRLTMDDGTEKAGAAVRVVGRQLLVDGKPYQVRGVCWNPVPKGGTFPRDLDFRGFADLDIPLMQAAGINTVRVYVPLTDRKVLDKLHEAGIRVMNTLYESGYVTPQMLMERVRAVQDHPANLMWLLGNEWNFNGLYVGLDSERAAERIRDAARLVRSLDASHPIATVHGELPEAGLVASMPEIDLWGINCYRNISFWDLFDQWAVVSPNRPFFLGEYGADAWDSRPGHDCYNPKAQAKATVRLTREILEHSSARDLNAVCIGGVLFEWADEWWKHLGGRLDVHNTEGTSTGGGPYPDDIFNEEWFGLVDIEREPREAYVALRRLYVEEAAALPAFLADRETVHPVVVGLRAGGARETDDAGEGLKSWDGAAENLLSVNPDLHI